MKAPVQTVRRLTKPLIVATALMMTVGITAPRAIHGQSKPAAAPAQKLDEEYTKKIVDLTPDKRILTDVVDHMPLPADPKVPSPLKFLGYIPGENGKLTYSKDVYEYLDALEKASPRVKLLVDRQDGGGPRHARAARSPTRRRSSDLAALQGHHGAAHRSAQDA